MLRSPLCPPAEPRDLEAFDIRLHAQGRLFTVAHSNAAEFGWINTPK